MPHLSLRESDGADLHQFRLRVSLVTRAVLRYATFGVVALLVSAIQAQADKRVALIIGNAAYQNTASLLNPVNDAQDLAGSLKEVGFTVILERNLDKRGMENAIARFARLAQDADAAMFFFAGHGIQYRGQNYLMPIDAKLEDEFNLNFELTRMDDVLFVLERARGVKILVLDACRNNPLAERLTRTSPTRDVTGTRGLARIDPARGMIVAYSTQQNQVAVDGEGRNSPFTTALIKQIDEPGVEVGTLFRRVAADVSRVTGGRQLPELSVSLVGEFYLNTRETDVQAWSKLRESDDPSQLKDFLARYSTSLLLPDVRQRLAMVELNQIERTLRERQLRQEAEWERLEKEHLARVEAEKERVAREQVERERLASIARQNGERERLDRERVAREQSERDRQAREQAERLARIENARIAQEQATRERAQREQAARVEEERTRIARQQAAGPTPPGAPPGNIQTAVLTPPAESPTGPKLMPPAPASSALIQDIKKELKRVGCYAGRIDDKWATADTKSSVQKFVRFARLSTTPNEPAADFLEALRGRSERVCPIECGAREVETNGRCVTKACPSGSTLGANGTCRKQQERAKTASRPPENSKPSDVRSPSGGPRRTEQEPPPHTLGGKKSMQIDDGSCPKGQIKLISANMGHRIRSCIPRPT